MDKVNEELIEYGIEFHELPEKKSFKEVIPVNKDDAIRLSGILSAAPTLISNAVINNELGGCLYTITTEGKNVIPDMLVEKNNGKMISNLKGEGGKFGKQADIEAFDSSIIDAATIASSVFAIASVATSQYYLKSIDDKLSEIQKTTRDILNFLEVDKQSKIESDFEILHEIIEQMDVIKAEDNLKSIKLEQISAIQRESKANIKFYKKLLEKALNEYKSNKMGGRQDNKIIGWVRQDYFYYRLSLQVYSLSKLAEIMLLSNFNEKYLRNIYEELHDYSIDIKDDINRILSIIYDYSYDKFENKVKHGFASTMKSVGGAVNKTPLKKTDLGGKLTKIGNNTNREIQGDTKRKADRIVTKDDYGVLEPYSEMVDNLLRMINGKVNIVGNDEGTFVMF
ncbi:MAG: hypothetical protein J5517_07550 [Eubacterium sp.]|nr:hypothetical protein [Eubacterium sp.]